MKKRTKNKVVGAQANPGESESPEAAADKKGRCECCREGRCACEMLRECACRPREDVPMPL